jgi:hypothetical protein
MAFLPLALLFGAVIFVPLLVIAIVKFKSPAIAFAVSATFAIGAAVGLFAGVMLGDAVVPRGAGAGGEYRDIYLFILGAAGSIGGAALALWLLRKMARDQTWEKR